MDLYKLVGREGNRFIVQDAEGNKQRRKLKPSEIQVIKQVDNKIDRNIIKEHAAEKKQRQVINKLIRGAEMKKDEAKKALEQLNIPEEKIKRAKKIDYAVLSATTFRNKKEVAERLHSQAYASEQIITPKTPVATIKKTESKPKIKKVIENIITPEQTITRETRAKKIDYAALAGTTFRTKK